MVDSPALGHTRECQLSRSPPVHTGGLFLALSRTQPSGKPLLGLSSSCEQAKRSGRGPIELQGCRPHEPPPRTSPFRLSRCPKLLLRGRNQTSRRDPS